MSRPIDERTRAQILRLRQNGLSVRETAKATRTSPATVQNVTAKKS